MLAGILNPNDASSGSELLTQEQIAKRQEIAAKMLAAAGKARPMTSPWQAAAQAAEGLFAGLSQRQADAASAKAAAYDRGLLTGDLGFSGGATAAAAVPAVTAGGGDTGPAGSAAIAGAGSLNVSPEIKTGIVQTASALGIDPVDLATTISYETGGTFDPTKAGPRTQWGQHRGLIQFGEPQAKQHGVDWSNPVGSQLGPNGAVASYLKTAGVKPGMGLLDIYSAINAGAPGLYDRSDANNGGAPGTVRDKVEKQMQGHRAKAMALFAQAQADSPATNAAPAELPTGQEGFAVPPSPVKSVPGDDPVKLREEAQYYAQTNPEAARQMLARADMAEAASAPQAAPMPMPPARPADLAVAPDPGSAMTGRTFDQVANFAERPLDPVFQSEGTAQPWMGTALQSQPVPAAPAAPVAQAMQVAPMPPPRPTDLRADMPAPGAVQAIGQLPVAQAAPPAMPDYTSMDSGGAREFAVADAQGRFAQPAPMAGPTAGMPVAQASLPPGAAPAPVTPVQRVAQAVAASQGGAAPAAAAGTAPASPAVSGVASALQGVNPRVLAAATSPYASPQTKQIAGLIIKQQLEAAKREDPLTVQGRKLDVEGKTLSNAKARRELEGEGAVPLTAEEKQSFGIKEGQSAYKTRAGDIKFGPAGTTVNVDTKADNAEAQARGAGVGKRLNDLAEDGAKAGEDAVLFQRFGDILSTVKTGKTTETLEKIRQATGLALDPNTDNVQALNAMIQYIGPRLRVPGSGAQSDRELGNFLASIPSLAGTPEGNKMILDTMQGIIGHRQQRAAIASEWQLGDISAKEAQKRIDALPSPFAKKEEAAPTGAPAVGDVRKGYRYKGGDPSQQSSWEKAQ